MYSADQLRHMIHDLEARLYELRMEAAEVKAVSLLMGGDYDFCKIDGHIERTRQKLDRSRGILADKGYPESHRAV